ncbi:hypothetical protein ES707_20755 [subsurface metagenome]
MDKKRKGSEMLIPTLIMGIIAFILLLLAYYRGQGQHIAGIRIALNIMIEILPLLILSFIVAGMVEVLIPKEIISKWIGEGSGIRGILIGTVAGSLTPGGPYVSLPVATGLLRSGASVGTIVAFLTGWSLWAVSRLPMEVGILGWRFTLIRIASTFFFPPIAGFIAQMFSRGLK